jgi:hypothetical protein
LEQKFDFVFFTGSQTVGKEVLLHTAEHLTPVVLELGGKSPCIVDESANIKLAAKRIVFGKFLNCGQTCIAPDYILCEKSVKEIFVKAVIELKYSSGISSSDQSRMQALMDEVEKHDMLDNIILLGSQYQCLIWTRENGYENIPCQYLVNSCENEAYLNRCIDYNFAISINVTANYSNSDEWLARYKEAGIKISTYTFSQFVDYDEVQEWIDKGVDFVTCDWHQMDKLNLGKEEE